MIVHDSSIIGIAGLNGLLIAIVALLLFGSLTTIGKKIRPLHTVSIFSLIAVVQFFNFISHPSVVHLYNYAFSDFAMQLLIFLFSRINYVVGGLIGTKVARTHLTGA